MIQAGRTDVYTIQMDTDEMRELFELLKALDKANKRAGFKHAITLTKEQLSIATYLFDNVRNDFEPQEEIKQIINNQ